MKFLPLLAVLVALPAGADLYRWRDPETGSLKFSNTPPPWYGDPTREAIFPRVEVVPDQSPQRKPPTPAPAALPVKPAAAPASPAALEARLATILQFFQSLPASGDFDRSSAAFQQQAEMYRAVSAELDRQDPAGAARRRAAAQETGILEQLRKGMEAQMTAKPPPPPQK